MSPPLRLPRAQSPCSWASWLKFSLPSLHFRLSACGTKTTKESQGKVPRTSWSASWKHNTLWSARQARPTDTGNATAFRRNTECMPSHSFDKRHVAAALGSFPQTYPPVGRPWYSGLLRPKTSDILRYQLYISYIYCGISYIYCGINKRHCWIINI